MDKLSTSPSDYIQECLGFKVAAVHAGSSAASRPIVDPSNSDIVSVMVSLLELGEF